MIGRTNGQMGGGVTNVNNIASIRYNQVHASSPYSGTFTVKKNQLIHIYAERFNDTYAPTISVTNATLIKTASGVMGNSGWRDEWYITTNTTVNISVSTLAGSGLSLVIN